MHSGDNKAAAYKGIVLLKRKAGVSREDLLDWALNKHSHFAISVSEISRYTTSLIVAPGPRYKFPDGEPPFDLIHEIWCADRESLDNAYAKLDAMGATQAALSSHFSQRIALIGEERVLK